MRRALAIDVARTLPAKPGRADPAPQCAGTDHHALCMQICGQQWYGPGGGVIVEPTRIAREELAQLLVYQNRRRARAAGSSPISQRRWRSFSKIALYPTIDRAAVPHAPVWQPRP